MALLANTGQGIAVLINVSGNRNVCEGAHLHKGKQEDLQLWRGGGRLPEAPTFLEVSGSCRGVGGGKRSRWLSGGSSGKQKEVAIPREFMLMLAGR